MAEEEHSKTEEPTPKKIADARKKGFVAKSNDLTIAFMLLFSMVFFFFFGPFMYRRLVEICLGILNNIETDITNLETLQFYLNKGISHILWMLFPMLAWTMFLAVIFNFLQIGLLFTIHPLAPKWKKLNAFNPSNYERNFGLPALVKLAFGLIRLLIVMIMSWIVMSHDAFLIFSLGRASVPDIFLFTYHKCLQVGFACAIGYVLIGIFDYSFQKWRFTKQMRMSRREVKDELKQLEGDLTVKSKIRSIMRGLSESSYLNDLRFADIIISDQFNHVIAIVYNSSKISAPVCLCKGSYKRGATIKDLARGYNIPIVEDPYLTKILYTEVNQGEYIPTNFYNILAALLAKNS